MKICIMDSVTFFSCNFVAKSMYKRALELEPFIDRKSLFLLGPRQTGKSTLLRSRLPETLYIDLLASDTFRAYSARPELLREVVQGHNQVIVDEIQKLPSLLDEIQWLIDTQNTRFLLTGSSARKLKRGRANLLGGRALFFYLHPLSSYEIGYDRIANLLQTGGLPGIVDSPIAWEELTAYVGAYLREEVQAEGLTRSIENFSRFLDIAVHFNAEQINYSKIGNDAEVPPRTVKDYVKILADTLLLHLLPPFKHAKGRKTVATEKVYFFDVGVANALARRKTIQPGTPEYGKAFEQLVFLELNSALHYKRLDSRLSYWRTRTHIEVDFLVDNRIAIAAKGTGKIANNDLKPLRQLDEELNLQRKIMVCNERDPRKTADNIEIMPLAEFCQQLWEQGLLEHC